MYYAQSGIELGSNEMCGYLLYFFPKIDGNWKFILIVSDILKYKTHILHDISQCNLVNIYHS